MLRKWFSMARYYCYSTSSIPVTSATKFVLPESSTQEIQNAKQSQFVSQVQMLHAMKQFDILLRKLSMEHREPEKIKLAQQLDSIFIFSRPSLINTSLALLQQLHELDPLLQRLEYYARAYPQFLLRPLIQIYFAKKQYKNITTFYKNNRKVFSIKQSGLIILQLQQSFLFLGEYDEAIDLLQIMKQEYNVEPSSLHYETVINCYLLQEKPEKAFTIMKSHFITTVPIGVLEYFVEYYCRMKELNQALQFLQSNHCEPTHWTRHIFQHLLHCAAMTKQKELFFKFVQQIFEHPTLSSKMSNTVKTLIVKLALQCEDVYILREYQYCFEEIDSSTMNALIDAFRYFKLENANQLVASSTINANNVWHDTLKTLVNLKKHSLAMGLFETLKHTTQLHGKVYSLMLRVYSKYNDELLMTLFREMEQKTLFTAADLDYLLQYCEQKGLLDFAETVFSMFDRMHRNRSATTYLHVLSMALKVNDKKLAEKYVELMRKENIALTKEVLELVHKIETI